MGIMSGELEHSRTDIPLRSRNILQLLELCIWLKGRRSTMTIAIVLLDTCMVKQIWKWLVALYAEFLGGSLSNYPFFLKKILLTEIQIMWKTVRMFFFFFNKQQYNPNTVIHIHAKWILFACNGINHLQYLYTIISQNYQTSCLKRNFKDG